MLDFPAVVSHVLLSCVRAVEQKELQETKGFAPAMAKEGSLTGKVWHIA